MDLKNFEILNLESKADLSIICRMGHYVSDVSDEERLLENDSIIYADRAKILLNSDDVTIGQVVKNSGKIENKSVKSSLIIFYNFFRF